MFRFFFSSRWTRFQYRLVSILTSALCRAAATVALGRGKCDFGFRGGLVKLGLLLALPVLYIVEVAR